MQIWPAVDIRSGKCVRLSQGDVTQETVYGYSPADMANRWVNDGAECLHIVDLDGAKQIGDLQNFEAICQIAAQTDVPLQVGGGIRDEDAIKRYLDIGVQRLVVGTRALSDPDWAIKMAAKYPGCIWLSLDSRDGLLATDGWSTTTNLSVVEFAKQMATHSIAGIVSTDIETDGMMMGPNFQAQRELRDTIEIPLIASGGVGCREDIEKLAALDVEGCVIGRALYEGRLTLADCIAAAERKPTSAIQSLGASPP